MTAAAAELCGHRWGLFGPHHRCDLPASHHQDQPRRPCACRCGTTAVKETER